MATEYPRQHVWRGRNGSSLTYLVALVAGDHYDVHYLLSKSVTPGAALALALSRIDISDFWRNITINIRPLMESELKKVSPLKDGEVIEIDTDSFMHLVERP